MEILQLREQLENARLDLAVKTEVSDGVLCFGLRCVQTSNKC